MPSPEEGAAALLRLTHQAKENFAQAFIAETGLLPSEAEMHYGPKVNETGHMEFRVWFTRKEEAEELRMLRALQDDMLKGDTLAATDKARMISLSFPREVTS